MVSSLETRLEDSESKLRTMTAEMKKLEKIREFIHDISGGSKKIYEE